MALALLPPGQIDIESQTWRKGLLFGRFDRRQTLPGGTCAFEKIPIFRSETMSGPAVVYGKVTRVLVEALNVDEDEVTPAATLQGDLGAESIDFLDIVFRLERAFGIKIPRGELFPESVFGGNPEYVSEGRVTEKGMRELRSRMPYADLDGFDRERRLSAVTDLFTVDLITRYVAWKLGQAAASEPNGARSVGAAPLQSIAVPASTPETTRPDFSERR
jgi:acyl carrier protein